MNTEACKVDGFFSLQLLITLADIKRSGFDVSCPFASARCLQVMEIDRSFVVWHGFHDRTGLIDVARAQG